MDLVSTITEPDTSCCWIYSCSTTTSFTLFNPSVNFQYFNPLLTPGHLVKKKIPLSISNSDFGFSCLNNEHTWKLNVEHLSILDRACPGLAHYTTVVCKLVFEKPYPVNFAACGLAWLSYIFLKPLAQLSGVVCWSRCVWCKQDSSHQFPTEPWPWVAYNLVTLH